MSRYLTRSVTRIRDGVETEITGCSWDPRRDSRDRNDVTNERTIIAHLRLIVADSNVDLTPRDRVRVEGDVYTIDAAVNRHTGSLKGIDHAEVVLRQIVLLGQETITVRTLTQQLDAGGNVVRDLNGDPALTVVETVVNDCMFKPIPVDGGGESDVRAEPTRAKAVLIAPPGTDIDHEDVVIWNGTTWQVEGAPRIWPEAVECDLRSST